MDTAGRFTLTPGTPQRFNCSRNAKWVSVRNDSPNYVSITCGPYPPTTITNAGSYKATLLPYSGDSYDVATDPATFDGVVYVLAITPADLASAGTISARQQFTINTYVAGETPPAPYTGIGRQSDLTSQSRIITIPSEPHQSQNLTIAASANGLVRASNGFIFKPGGGWPPANLSTIYLYGLELLLWGTRMLEVNLNIATETNANVLIADVQILSMVLRAGLPFVFTPPSPANAQLAIAANADHFALYCQVLNFGPNTANAANTWNVNGNVLFDIDTSGQTPPPGIGNGAATPPGTIY